MSLIIRAKASKKELQEIAEHFEGYIKVVVDFDREILAGGGDRHSDDERILLDDGSKQKDLWGGGLDIETGEIDYNSIINLRPKQDNPSRDILSKEIREKFDKIVKKLLL
jgi:hypothetical protein